MTVTGGDPADEPTRVDREMPSFPSVDSASQSAPAYGAAAAPLFTSHDAPPPPTLSGPETSPIVSQPIDPPSSSKSGGGSRLRWLVAAVATILVFTIVGGVLFLAAPHSGTPGLPAHYAPADTSAYFEFRTDMPGDQKANLAQFASHFPGFADQAAFQSKLDETLNSYFAKSGTGLDWNNDIKPWFGGQIGVYGDFVMPSPMGSGMAMLGANSTSMQNEKFVIVVSVNDKAKLQSVIDAHIGNSQVASVDYQGQSIKTIAQPGGTSFSGSYVVTDDALLVAPDIDQVKKGLDVNAGTGGSLAADDYFVKQLGALHADRLATFYYDAGKVLASQQSSMSNSMLPAQCMQTMQAPTRVKLVGEVRAEGDHMAVNVRSQLPSGDNAPPAPSNRQTTLAQAMPKDTVFYLETHNLGATLGWAIKNMLSCASSLEPSGSPLPGASGSGGNAMDPSKLFEQLAGTKPEEYLDFVDDAALGVSYSNDKVGVGLVASVDDEATAKARVNKIFGLLQLAGGGVGGGSGGAQISTSESDHNGTTVTTITVASPMSDASDVSLQVAVANGRLYLGLDDFVTSALDRQSADSLATSSRYQKAISAGPSDNAGLAFLDVAAFAQIYEEKLPATAVEDFTTNSKPYIDPLSSLSFVGHVDSGMLVSNMNLFVE